MFFSLLFCALVLTYIVLRSSCQLSFSLPNSSEFKILLFIIIDIVILLIAYLRLDSDLRQLF